ncbi:MAG TPA: hypothetical protein DCQ31_18395 [Bacteroidales bacterium]|nr:hypothetical protein [Bacteroidales bacterium]
MQALDKALNIVHLKNHEVNTIKWDTAIANAVNGMPYAYSWYLDIVHPEWEALVADDYSYVMPLTCNKKLAISYLFQPLFTQQLGVFSTEELSPNLIELMLDAIPKKYRFIEINLNTFNKLDRYLHYSNPRLTYQMDLVQNYPKLHEKYSYNARRNLRKSEKNGLYGVEGMSAHELINFYKENIGSDSIKHKPEDYDTLKRLIISAIRFRVGYTYGVYDKNNTLLSAAFYLHTHGKTILLILVSSKEGKTLGAGFYLVDKYIKINAEKNIVLDFEGSMLPGVARFYAGFGAKPYKYPSVKINNLPFPFRFLKK